MSVFRTEEIKDSLFIKKMSCVECNAIVEDYLFIYEDDSKSYHIECPVCGVEGSSMIVMGETQVADIRWRIIIEEEC